jgi:hypothetical protein
MRVEPSTNVGLPFSETVHGWAELGDLTEFDVLLPNNHLKNAISRPPSRDHLACLA